MVPGGNYEYVVIAEVMVAEGIVRIQLLKVVVY